MALATAVKLMTNRTLGETKIKPLLYFIFDQCLFPTLFNMISHLEVGYLLSDGYSIQL